METIIEKLGKVSITIEGEHSIMRDYKRLSLVTVTSNDRISSFISKKDVPAGIAIINSEYWIPIARDPNYSTVRTINHERLNGTIDANLQDGFYFPNAVQDYEGHWYGAVIIGDQVWLAENLKTTHYTDGTEIEYSSTGSSKIPYYSYPNDDSNNVDTYGLLYNYSAAVKYNQTANTIDDGNITSKIKGIAPIGWHIPSTTELQELRAYLGQQERYNSETNSIAKSVASVLYWLDSQSFLSPGKNKETNNASGFNAIPTGSTRPGGSVINFNTKAAFWSSTGSFDSRYGIADSIEFYNTSTNIGLVTNISAAFRLSIRCISDLNPIQFRNWYIQQYGSLQHHLSDSVPSGDSNVRIVNLTTILPSQESSSPTIECDTSVMDMLMDIMSNDTCIIIKSRTVAIEDNEEIEQYSMYFMPATIVLANATISFIGYIAVFGGWFIWTLLCSTDGTSDNFHMEELINGNKFTTMVNGIPMPTYGDEGKILKVDNTARYYLAEP